MRVHIKSTQAAGHWRCGVRLSKQGAEFQVYEGKPVKGGLSTEELARMEKDPRVVVTALAEDEPAPVDPAVALAERVRAAIAALEPGDFDQNGKPKLGALREALPDDAKAITADLRDEVYTALLTAGFTAGA